MLPLNSLKSVIRSVENRVRFPKSSIGDRTFIERGSRLDRDVVLGNGCFICNCDLGEGVRVGDNTHVSRSVRMNGAELGGSCMIGEFCMVYNSMLSDHVSLHDGCVCCDVTVGRCSYIAREAYINDVTMGAFCSIGPRAMLGCGDHPVDMVSSSPVFYSTRRQCGVTYARSNSFEERRSIQVGNDVWLGANVFVCDGVRIGDGAVVAAGAVVTKDVPPYAIVGGVPAKIIRSRFSGKDVESLLELRWWDWSDSRLESAQQLISGRDVGELLRWSKSN